MNNTNNTNNVNNVNNTNNANNVNNPNCANTDCATVAPNAKSPDTSTSAIESIQPSTNQPTVEAARPNANGSVNGKTQNTLTRQEQARLHSLRAMLNASNARFKQATRNRRPKFSAGLNIIVLSGDHSGKSGVVIDADYIANRALISLSNQESPHWIAFQSLGYTD